MRRYTFLAILLLLLIGRTNGQQPDTLIRKLDSARIKTNETRQRNVITKTAYNENTRITFRNDFVLLASDVKQQVSKPFHMTKERLEKGLPSVVLAIAALTFADEPIQRNMLDIRNRNPALQDISKFVTNTGGPYEVITLGVLATSGFLFRNEKLKTSSLLATQSYLTSALTHTLIKLIAGRQRPFFYDPNEVEAEPRFRGPFHKAFKDQNGKNIGSSFPSGHTAGAFAAATSFCNGV